MRILIVRHGDPDYEIDGLTEKGKREVQLLADKLEREDMTAIYCSPLGRAQRTIEPTLERLGRSMTILPWLHEFSKEEIKLPYLDYKKPAWDLLPSFMAQHPELYSPTEWRNVDFIKNSKVGAYYDEICTELDALLARHGYERDGVIYRAVKPSHDTVVLVCHYGVTAVMLSHLFNCSPYSFWQQAVTLPTSVTTIYTEEREEGIASFRCCGIGDVSHLYAGGEPAAFAARFCECFTDDTRHH